MTFKWCNALWSSCSFSLMVDSYLVKLFLFTEMIQFYTRALLTSHPENNSLCGQRASAGWVWGSVDTRPDLKAPQVAHARPFTLGDIKVPAAMPLPQSWGLEGWLPQQGPASWLLSVSIQGVSNCTHETGVLSTCCCWGSYPDVSPVTSDDRSMSVLCHVRSLNFKPESKRSLWLCVTLFIYKDNL